MSCQYHVMSYHVMSCHVMSCHVTSSHVFSRLVISCHVMSCHVMSRLVMSCHVISRVLTSCHVMSRLVMSCHLASSHVFSRLVVSCHVMSCHVLSCHVLSSHVFSRLVTSCHIMSSCSRILLPNLSSEPSKFFYYGGGVAPTRFSKPWPCAGIRLGATLSLWRRVHCERLRVAPCAFLGPGHRFAWQAAGIGRVASVRVWRRAHFCDPGIVLRGRLRGSGVLRACRGRAGGRAAALCRGDWVPGVFCTRMANVRFAWQAAGIVRAGSALGGGSVLAGRVGGAVPWGLGSGCVSRAHDFTRCDLRFAWQAWDSGFIDALGKALDGGSAWQAQ